MRPQELSKKIVIALVAGLLAVGGATALAEEDPGRPTAASVRKHTEETIKVVKEALTHAKAGHKDETAATLKTARQHSKEIVGDSIGKLTQKVQGDLKAAIKANIDGDSAKAAELIEETLVALTEIEKAVK